MNKMRVPQEGVKKGENGRVLVIGGSKLFHAASFWSAGMASRLVDLVHFSSPAMENNELMRVRAKSKFWEGIVVPWSEVEHYVEEDDVVLIGPGMTRGVINSKLQATNNKQIQNSKNKMQKWAQEDNTKEITNYLLKKYPEKRWVVDGGALQEVDVSLFNKNMVITPNKRELEILMDKSKIQNPKLQTNSKLQIQNIIKQEQIKRLAQELGVMMLAKGVVDIVTDGEEVVEIEGGSAGMVKGGTGDVLSGLVAGLYAKNTAMESAVLSSRVCKRAGEKLEERVGPYFSASELLNMVPEVMRGMI